MNKSPNTKHQIPITHYPSPITHYLTPILLFLLTAGVSIAGELPTINGQVKFSGTLSRHASDGVFSLAEDGTYLDGQGDLRLKNTHYFSDRGYILTHYEAVLSGGDTRRNTNALLDMLGGAGIGDVFFLNTAEDDRRLMDLTHVFSDEDGHIGYHRLDRLAVGYRYKHGSVVFGRQAQTWGNGMVFNPMDLFNPFSPTDIQRDYKIGDDMISATVSTGGPGDLQLLLVPRRDPAHDVKWDQSSLAVKWHLRPGALEMDLMGARHYKDVVVGLGGMGYAGNAAWRVDGTWTFLSEDPNALEEKNGFFSLVANLDYSWVWGGKNLYGFIEYYHNGLGRSDAIDALFDENLLARLARGELFTLGRNYLAAMVQYEHHPLLNITCTVIEDLHGPSGILLPRAVWNARQNLEITLGATIFTGNENTEFGGIAIPFTDLYYRSPNSAFLWATWYF